MKFILTISSITIILFSGLYLYQENIATEWRVHQQAYLDEIDSLQAINGASETGTFSFDIGLKQIWLPEMNRADRCISCHVAIEDPLFEEKSNLLKKHPQDFLETHDADKFGCTICHDGQGRAVTFKDAAADDPDVFWDKPLLRSPYSEANCYRCHVDALEQTPMYNKGKVRFETSGCLGCHRRDGKGGLLGPELRGIGNANVRRKHVQESFDVEVLSQLNVNRNLAYIYEAVRFPGAQPNDTVMYDFRLSHEDTIALTVYLKGLAAYPTGTQRLSPKPAYPLSITDQGKEIFGLFCAACHGNSGRGGTQNINSLEGYIPKLNTLSDQMFLTKREHRKAVISILTNSGDLLQADSQPDIRGFFKVIAKYMSVKNTMINGRIVEKKARKDLRR